MARIVMVADIHAGCDRPTRPGSQAIPLLGQLVAHVNEHIRPDVVVDLGDRIHDEHPLRDAEHMAAVATVLSRLEAPLIAVPGNHDPGSGPGGPWPQVHHVAGLAFVGLNTNDPILDEGGGSLSDRQLDAFETVLGELEGRGEPVVVVSHHPLDHQSAGKNPLFAEFPHAMNTREGARAREIMARHRGVVAAFSGHVHWGSLRVMGGIPYVAVPSLTERWQEGTAGAPGAFAVAGIEADRKICVDFRTLEPGLVVVFQS